ncbi:MAG: efflux RND transporter periplasmic adaptor subunit [Pseudomonadota bacterium]
MWLRKLLGLRFAPLITSIFVGGAIYLFVMERDALNAFAGVETEAAEDVVENASVDAIAVQVLRSQAQPFESGVVLRGRTEAFRTVDVAAEISGTIISQPLRKGEVVSEGQLLCQLDPGTLEAALNEARARLEEAIANDKVSSTLVERGFASETTVITRQAELEAAEAAVKRAEEDLTRLSIAAPFGGVLETDTAELGKLLQPGSACATVISLDPIRLVGFATEEQITLLKTNLSARARLVTGEILSGEITFLSRSSDPQTRTFRVEVSVPNPDLAIRDGSTAEIAIALPGQTGHSLPHSALTLNDDGVLGVRVAEDGIVTFYPTEVLNDSASEIWVTGLPDTSDVIIVGQEYVVEGSAVDPTIVERNF